MKKLVASMLSVSMVLSAVAPSFAESKKYADQSTRDIAVGSAATAAFLATSVTAPITGGLVGASAVAPVLITPAVAAVAAVAPALVIPAVEAVAASTIYTVGDTFAVNALCDLGITAEIGSTVSLTTLESALVPLGDTFAEATMIEVGNHAAHFVVTEVAAVPGSPAVFSAGTPGVAGSPAVYSQGVAATQGVTPYRPDSLFGIQTATLIQGAAIGLFVGGVLIPWITGTNINPSGADVLVCDGFDPASGKGYRYGKGTNIFEQCMPKVAATPQVAKPPASIGLSPNTPARPAPTVRPSDEPAMAPAPVKRLPKKG
jgi:hypothetical protein